ncbi:NUDIX hydrolase [Pontiella agarivorans]|uniref:NUDIX hydrolase n=1 Tax=Pontiella agarivorans TaxID=3038953 RepID=A0ABU5MWI3_9BACT|nr:NUDIX hydrolase [Pontiella agarivorans]MDZ8118487.1 NUDIX hydrolase [Pontiella agarivorans]
MHRNDLLSRLRTYRKTWPNEKDTADRLIGFVETHPDCFERSLQVGHITGSAWLVNRAGTHVLLTHHRKLDMWLQLGGHADGNTDIIDAARQEALEESGIRNLTLWNPEIFDLDIHRIPERKNEPAHFHHDVRFVFQCLENEDYIVSEESHDLQWVDIQSLEKFTHEESMLRMKRKWLQLLS